MAAEIYARATAAAAADPLRVDLGLLDIPLLESSVAYCPHIIAIGSGLGEGHGNAESAWVQVLRRALVELQVTRSLCRGALRLSIHAWEFPVVMYRACDLATCCGANAGRE